MFIYLKSVAIVCMINNTALKLVPENYTIETQTSGLINLNDSNGVQFENQNQTHDSDLSQTKKSQTVYTNNTFIIKYNLNKYIT